MSGLFMIIALQNDTSLFPAIHLLWLPVALGTSNQNGHSGLENQNKVSNLIFRRVRKIAKNDY
jgi:hypothetical protein